MNCPICDEKLKVDGNVHEDGRESCPSNHYFYSHSYGCHEEHFDVYGDGHITLSLGWHYTEAQDTTAKRIPSTDAFVAYARELRKKHEG